ncbi:zinc finger protein 37-like isoform X2 [Mugil cephalus]|uniref:zinc finger protein 37-like isoform X2 n=1 Tax=Mugil cephalus TaxID=48193 RepID=UPI001FB8240B|nr:zinc finger protein 37-like isoform X2 [Mugil cephalus]
MFYWMKPVDSAVNMSKTDILRGIVTEKLSTAAREILAVVERTVADYEKEAAGFRCEIERQRRQLELLQPRVKLERTALVSDLDNNDVVVSRDKEGEPAHVSSAHLGRQTSDVDLVTLDEEDSGSMGVLWYDDNEDEVDDEEEEQRMQLLASSRQKQEDLKDPDFEMPSRLFSPRVQSCRRKPGRPSISDSQDHIDLRIRVLEDSQTDVLSNTIFKKCPVQELQCPRGLQEDDFLSLLRSTFPQLAADEPFDFLTTDRTRRLQPLKLKTVTPQEVHRAIRSTGNSALYIRLKTTEDPQSEGRKGEGEEATTSASQTEMKPRRKRGRPRLNREPDQFSLRVCMLEDQPQTDVPPNTVLQRSSIEDLTCPQGLQEPEFLDLLRSTFPRLAGDDRPLVLYKSDRNMRLRRINLTTLTPEEIYKAIKSTRPDKSLLYVKLKTSEEEEEEEELQLSPTNDEPLSSDTLDVKGDDSSNHHSDGDAMNLETEEGAAQSEEDGYGDSDWDPDPELQHHQSKPTRERKSGVLRIEKCKTPCKVCGISYRNQASLIKHAWSHAGEPQGVCGVCGGSFKSTEELTEHLRSYQKTHDCSYCGKSFFTVTGLSCHVSTHTGDLPFKCNICSKAFSRIYALNIHQWTHVTEKPHKCDICQKSFGLMGQLRAHVKMHLGRDKYRCHVCGRSLYDLRSLNRHKMTHTTERRYGCDICGKRFKLPGTLKSHKKIHTERERPYLCHICCKTFMSNVSLTVHIRTHSGERPFVCSVCSKGFISNGDLKHHMRVHTGEAPYSCPECGRFFKHKSHLDSHVRSHLGIKRFTCGVCGKPCARQEHLTVHMRTHNGERPYKCTMCEKAFTQSHCLKTHLKSHQAECVSISSASTSTHVFQEGNQTA